MRVVNVALVIAPTALSIFDTVSPTENHISQNTMKIVRKHQKIQGGSKALFSVFPVELRKSPNMIGLRGGGSTKISKRDDPGGERRFNF